MKNRFEVLDAGEAKIVCGDLATKYDIAADVCCPVVFC